MKKHIAFCFDFDGTVTSEEVIPLIAREIDIFEEIKILTDATINGLIPLENSLKLRLKLLSEIDLNRIQSIIYEVSLNNQLVNFINNNHDDCFIVTANMDLWLLKIMNKIKCKFYTSKVSYKNNKIDKYEILNKGTAIEQLRNQYEKIVCIGDGMGDVSMFQKADIGIAYGGVHFPVSSLLEYTNFYVKSEEVLCQLLKTL